MPETFTLSELVIPGTYIDVRAEALIGAGAVSTGNIGIVGTARRERQQVDDDGEPVVDADENPVMETDPRIYGTTHTLSDYATAQERLGRYDANNVGKLNLTRAVEILFRNGARTVYARPLALGANDAQPGTGAYTDAFNELLKDDVNILIAPQLSTDDALDVLPSILDTAETNGQDLIAVVGSDATSADDITEQVISNDRLILTAPSIVVRETIEDRTPPSLDVTLSGTYTAAAVAGLLSTLAPEDSPTNKVLSGVKDLTQRFSYADEKDLINGGVLVLERRLGVRVVRGVTTQMAENGPFRQITTRRITDFAKAGIRQASNPFIGRLNNQRVRAALRGAIDGFLTTMVLDEALTGYTLEVTATRQDEIEGRAIVNAVIQPTFSIDFVAVTMALE